MYHHILLLIVIIFFHLFSSLTFNTIFDEGSAEININQSDGKFSLDENAIYDSLRVFHELCKMKWFAKVPIVLLFNKIELLQV